ncbi:MAG: omptin family outer membrane protease [Treponema sp.]|nr:omptin family outer membrane protease [Treponema sp.]
MKIGSHDLSIGTSLGFLAGEGEEIVYRNEISSHKLSQLLWKFEPVVYAGIDLNYNWKLPLPSGRISLFAGTSFKFGLPSGQGAVEDRDWMHPSITDFLTHYSVSTIKTENAILLDTDIGTAFAISENFSVKAFISYGFMHFYWKAKGGSFLYPDDDGDNFYYPNSITVGTYKQTWHILSAGTSLYYRFNPKFDIEPFIKVSPLIWCSSLDEHLAAEKVITDTMFGGLFLEFGLQFSFKPADFLTLSLFCTGRIIDGARGNGFYEGDGVLKETGKPTLTAKNMAGAGYNAAVFGAAVKLNIF